MYTLDWHHAWTGRLPQAPLQTSATQTCAARLAHELSAQALPFFDLHHMDALTPRLLELTPWLQNFKHMVVLGIGGSALGTKALQQAFFPEQHYPNHHGGCLWVLDNVDAGSMTALMERLDPTETLIVPISKSGGTIETVAQYVLFREWLEQRLGDAWREHVLCITDAENGYLREEAVREHLKSLPIPRALGGRYSVLSAVGLVPAAFMGLDWQDLIAGARRVTEPLVHASARVSQALAASAKTDSPTAEQTAEATTALAALTTLLTDHPAWQLANWCFQLYQQNYSQLIFFGYIPAWAGFGDWFAQLWAESLGKDGKGTMPLPAVGVTDQHSLQQMFLAGQPDKGCLQVCCDSLPAGGVFPATIPEQWHWLRGKTFGELLQAEAIGTAAALKEHAVPLVRLHMEMASLEGAGAFMGLCMAATLFTGWLMDINPLDQPAVELGKRLAYARLGSQDYPHEAAMLTTFVR